MRKRYTGRLGFTLIELLVAVLIIGIMSAVALPQYQRAVEKSRATQALTMLKSVYQAAKSYQLANGSWPTQFEELDVEIPWTGNTPFVNGMKDTLSNENWSIQLYFGGENYNGVWLGRIAGDYQQAGFAMFNSYGNNATVDKDRIVCAEHSVNFVKEPGAFCEKLFHATFARQDTFRYYQMP